MLPKRMLVSMMLLLLVVAPSARSMMDDMEMGGMSGGSMQGGGASQGMGSMGGMGGMSMGGMGGMGGMGAAGAPAGAAGGMLPRPDAGADVMGRMREPMSRGAMRSRLPGFPGASHLYHVGATGFFLDHPQHITLSTEQQTRLNRIRERVALERAESDRRIEEAEQRLWTLTAADAPDATQVDEQVRLIERLRADVRLAHIRAVGEAAQVLTPAQHASLLGTAPPSGHSPAPSGGMKPGPMKPMRGM